MPPKKPSATEDGGGLTEQQQTAQNQHMQLLNKAVNSKILCTTGASQQSECLPPSKALLKCNGKDIVKKSSTRKNRYLLVFNARIAPSKAGPLGTLAQLDTKNPVLYMDFPEGRLKFFGTLVFPKNKYMVLKAGRSSEVLCEDVFENMVVFSDVWWVGTAEENPEEKKLPVPASLSTNKLHESYDYGFGASDAYMNDIPPKAGGGSRPKPAEKRDRPEDGEAEEEDDVERDSGDDEPLTARVKRSRSNAPDKPQQEDGNNAVRTEGDAAVKSGTDGSVPPADQPAAGQQNRAAPDEPKPSSTSRQHADGKLSEEPQKRRTSMRLEGTVKHYAEDMDDDTKGRGKVDSDNERDNGERAGDSNKGDDEKPQKKTTRSSAKSSKQAVHQQRQAKGEAAPGTSKGRGSPQEEDEALIVLDSSDDEVPVRRARVSRTPQRPASQSGKVKRTAHNSQAETIELLDTPLKATPSVGAPRATPTKRLAALRQSVDALKDEDQSQREDDSEGVEGEDSDSEGDDDEDVEDQDEDGDEDNDEEDNSDDEDDGGSDSDFEA